MDGITTTIWDEEVVGAWLLTLGQPVCKWILLVNYNYFTFPVLLISLSRRVLPFLQLLWRLFGNVAGNWVLYLWRT